MDRTTIQVSEEVRKNLKILASQRDVSYQDMLEDFINIFNSIIPFKDEAEFSTWFEKNVHYFGFKKIIEKRGGYPDFLLEDHKGKSIRVELEVVGSDFIRHKHDPRKVDLIICVFSDKDEIMGVPVVSIVEKYASFGSLSDRRVRLSVSLDSALVSYLDDYTDKTKSKSRSEAVENILREYIERQKTCVILAGGEPKKLFIKELGVYRPLAKINGFTLIEDIVYKVTDSGYTNILIVGFKDLLSKMFPVLGNGEKFNAKITYVEEKKALGSAKTLQLARKYLRGDFLFLPCDHYFDFDLRKLQNFHLASGSTATIGVHSKTSFDWGKSVVVMEGDKIIEYEESPKIPKTHLIAVFIGFMNDSVFNLIPKDGSYSLQENIFPNLANSGKLMGYPVAGDWINVHTKKDVEKVITMRSSAGK